MVLGLLLDLLASLPEEPRTGPVRHGHLHDRGGEDSAEADEDPQVGEVERRLGCAQRDAGGARPLFRAAARRTSSTVTLPARVPSSQ
jgi:hypothetical protein